MKTRIIILAIMLFVSGAALNAQKPVNTKVSETYNTYKIVDGKIVTVKKSAKYDSPDPVVAIIDGDTIYQGKKGGMYEKKISKKTGKEYRKYVPKEKK